MILLLIAAGCFFTGHIAVGLGFIVLWVMFGRED